MGVVMGEPVRPGGGSWVVGGACGGWGRGLGRGAAGARGARFGGRSGRLWRVLGRLLFLPGALAGGDVVADAAQVEAPQLGVLGAGHEPWGLAAGVPAGEDALDAGAVAAPQGALLDVLRGCLRVGVAAVAAGVLEQCVVLFVGQAGAFPGQADTVRWDRRTTLGSSHVLSAAGHGAA